MVIETETAEGFSGPNVLGPVLRGIRRHKPGRFWVGKDAPYPDLPVYLTIHLIGEVKILHLVLIMHCTRSPF